MESLRSPFQGVYNILRFNWHFYLLAAAFVILLLLFNYLLPQPYYYLNIVVISLIVTTTIISLFISWYIYDLSGFYALNWLNGLAVSLNSTLMNINAGFDETSNLLKQKYPDLNLIVCDFYDPIKHTEVSIKRARKAYLPYEKTITISTNVIAIQDNYMDNILMVFSAHEIREAAEREIFFIELKRVLKTNGKIILIEHLRDMPNFLAYNVGFFHFIPRSLWCNTFKNAGLNIYSEEKITPFVTKFILEK